MELRQCGTSELILSALGLGCWEFGGGDYWGESDQQNVTRIVRRAVDLGVTYFDTAEAYNEGRSEEFLGKALKDVPRDRVIVGSKIVPSNLYPNILIEHCEASLRRLGMDYLDLYMIHWPLHPQSIKFFTKDEIVIKHPPTLEEAVPALLKLQEQGKIRYLGLSNFGVPRFEEIAQIGGRYAANQLGYSLLTRAPEIEIFPYCKERGVGVIAYMVLMQALLTDKYQSFDEMPDWHTRTRHFNYQRSPLGRHGEAGAEPETWQALTDIRAIARECGLSTADVALKWVLANDAVTCALMGTQNLTRLEANIKAAEEPLPQEIIARLNSVTEPLKTKLGPSLDIFESAANDRTQ